MGNFNFPDICWTTLSGQSTSSRAICNLAFRHDLSQMVDFPTYISGNTSDLIFSPPMLTVTDLQSISCPLLKSDHHILSFSSSISHSHTKCLSHETILDYKRADFDNISFSLMNHDFSSYYQSTDIEFLWDYVKSTILSSISLYTPVFKKDLTTIILSGSTHQ